MAYIPGRVFQLEASQNDFFVLLITSNYLLTVSIAIAVVQNSNHKH